MAPPTHIKTAVILLIFHITSSHSAKNTAKHTAAAVHEIVNEQARIDDKKVFTSPGIPSSGTLPYGNPLAGNSHHNAQLHAQNQQAMFNAEKIRQHRAQLQRWNKSPTHTDSYMRAYHESQESHQLALEQQQANLKETKPTTSTVRTPSRRRQNLRQDLKRTKGPDPMKIMAEDAVLSENNRNHRSYGSDEYQQYLQPNKYKTVLITPGPTYDQGVTIKPNGNVGLPQYKYTEEPNQLYTQALPTQYVYPKQYRQMQHYESAKDIETLNALLSKEPQDQLTELNSLIHFDKQNSKELETPIDLYFYLKNPSLAQHYEKSLYTEGQNYGGGYAPEVKDHTPITEEVDDIEDPNKHAKRPFIPQPSKPEDITTNNINYVHIEPTVVTKPEYHLNEIDKPSYQALKYEKPLTFYSQEANEEDSSERYLHHNGQHTGVQLLNHDGTGVSAFGDDNLHYAANYEFGYRVRDHHTGNDFGHHEAKTGGSTKGHYHVLLPDGRMQNVKYHAGPEGFHADISYDLQK